MKKKRSNIVEKQRNWRVKQEEAVLHKWCGKKRKEEGERGVEDGDVLMEEDRKKETM